MKPNNFSVILFVSIMLMGYSNAVLAESCYAIGGSTTTENVTSTLQIGNMSLRLSDQDGGAVVFSETGSLVGNITRTDGFGATFLSHKARFPQGDSFVTEGDRAVLAYPYVRDTLEDGTPCSFWIHEIVSSIKKGTNFFGNVTFIEMFADGYISNCPNENENYFKLSGKLCVE